MWMLLTPTHAVVRGSRDDRLGNDQLRDPVCWSTRLSQAVSDEPESGGGLLVGAIQLAVLSGGALGGYLLDRTSITGTLRSPVRCSVAPSSFYCLPVLLAAGNIFVPRQKAPGPLHPSVVISIWPEPSLVNTKKSRVRRLEVGVQRTSAKLQTVVDFVVARR